MKKWVLGEVLLAVLLMFFPHLSGAEGFTCLACHGAMKGKIRTDKGLFIQVNIDEERFSRSVHGGFDCTACHKGFKDNPHEPPAGKVPKGVAELSSRISTKAIIDPVAAAACVECHEAVYTKYTVSVHGKNIMEKKQKDAALCTDCHGSAHYIVPGASEASPVNKKNIVATCGVCHEEPGVIKKYNLGAHIIAKYNESFHGKKYKLGHPTVPACVDCHGAHDIRKWDDPASPVSWEKRIETCGKCHPGANKKFVASITHKPVGKDNPIPYYAAKGLIVLTMGTLGFVMLHVFLEAYADIRDHVFRKKKEESHD